MDDLIVPPWLSDPEAVAPCPCGDAMQGPMFLMEAENGLKYAYHYNCLKQYTGYDPEQNS